MLLLVWGISFLYHQFYLSQIPHRNGMVLTENIFAREICLSNNSCCCLHHFNETCQYFRYHAFMTIQWIIRHLLSWTLVYSQAKDNIKNENRTCEPSEEQQKDINQRLSYLGNYAIIMWESRLSRWRRVREENRDSFLAKTGCFLRRIELAIFISFINQKLIEK